MMINKRGWFVLLYLGALCLGIYLGGRHAAFGQTSAVDCQEVRETVAHFRAQGLTYKQMEQIARQAGATDQMVAQAQSCIGRHGVRRAQ
jgi:uncharacterized protein (DUF2344 family)